jgi:phage antirepressor YoqD-like protein
VDNYSSQFQEFGSLEFKMEPVKREGERGTKHEKFYLLNEDQAYFLMTLVRNTAQAVELKKRLVMAFAECRNNAQPAQTFDLAAMTGQALRELACKIEECALLNARIITLQPKADFYDHVAGSEALFDRSDAAKLLRTGPKRLWSALREWKIVQTSGTPYQKYYDAGYFRLVPVLVHKGEYSIPYQQTMVTGKGLTWLKALMDSRVMPGKELVKADAAS